MDSDVGQLADFADVAEVADAFSQHGYITDQRLATTVFLMSRLGKPVLLEGPAGVGKTELAKTLALATGRRLLRLQCYEGQDETKALYEWDYGKQMLYTQMLREKIGQIVGETTSLHDAVEAIGAQESVFFSDRFLAARPLLDAVRSELPVVLLIDEVDRADEALEAVLLEMLAEFQVSVPEIGTFVAEHRPYVVLTSNNTRDLSPALKRRCLHLFLDYPSAERELTILRSKDTGLSEALEERLIQVVWGLRDLDLRKAPSISETIDWARTLAVLGVAELNATVLADTISVVAKYEKDVARSVEALPRLVARLSADPNAKAADRVVPGHAHRHGDHEHAQDEHGDHEHAGGEEPDRQHPHADDGTATSTDNPSPPVDGAVDGAVDGKAIRAAKDRPGRHGPGHYGTPSSQGSRSFAARTRRNPG
ncbi:MAG: MoxR family ATPase [Geodermatophilaceae bacterium]|nr:MoxR family ATPase [Geodermatophilaceae bacterium]